MHTITRDGVVSPIIIASVISMVDFYRRLSVCRCVRLYIYDMLLGGERVLFTDNSYTEPFQFPS